MPTIVKQLERWQLSSRGHMTEWKDEHGYNTICKDTMDNLFRIPKRCVNIEVHISTSPPRDGDDNYYTCGFTGDGVTIETSKGRMHESIYLNADEYLHELFCGKSSSTFYLWVYVLENN